MVEIESMTSHTRCDPEEVRVILVGGSPLLQAGMITAFATDPRLRLVAQMVNVMDSAAVLRQEPCDVLVLNSGGPHVEVALLVEQLANLPDRPRLLVLTEVESREELLATLHLGVDGYGIRDHLWPEDLCTAVLTLARGDAWICPRATRYLMGMAVQQEVAHAVPTNRQAPLSQRELEVLRLAAAGAGEEDIASSLFLSRNTVKTYLRRIREKLQADSRAEAVSLAIQRGLLPDRRVLAAS